MASPKGDDPPVPDPTLDAYRLRRPHWDRTSAQERGRVTGGKAMVFLALEPEAAMEALALARLNGAAVWVGADAMSQDEHYRIAREGINLTRFAYSLSGNENADVEGALATVREHHPGETIWVQAKFVGSNND